MTSEDVQTNLRLPAELKERVVKAAAQNKRSLSAEVAARLEESFHNESAKPMMKLSDLADMDRLAELMRSAAEQGARDALLKKNQNQ